MTWIEVVDSGVKIGLGALIASVTTMVVTRSNQRHEGRKEFAKRRHEVLAQFVNTFEPVARDLVEATTMVSTWQRIADEVKANLRLREKLSELLQRLLPAVTALQMAEGRLLLLDLPAAAATLSSFRKLLIQTIAKCGAIEDEQERKELFDLLLNCMDTRLELYGRLANALQTGSDRSIRPRYGTNNASKTRG